MKSKVTITALILIIIIVGIGVHYLNSLPASTPEVQPRIVSHTTYLEKVDSITYFTVVGVVQNNLGTNIESVNVSATFYDAENNLIGRRFSPTALEILEPEQRAPFEIYLLLNSSTDIADICYELTLSYVKTSEETISGLVILNRTSSIDINGYCRISGEVQNKGIRKAVSVKMFCTYYDSEGNLLAVSHTYVSSEMEASEKASFELSSKPHKISPASYELLIVAHHYESLIDTHYQLLLILIIVFVLFIAFMKRRGW